MLEDIDKSAIVGTKQVLKAMQAGILLYVYIAEDVDAFLQKKLTAAAQEASLEVRTVPTMQELGESCGIDVGAACVGVKKAGA